MCYPIRAIMCLLARLSCFTSSSENVCKTTPKVRVHDEHRHMRWSLYSTGSIEPPHRGHGFRSPLAILSLLSEIVCEVPLTSVLTSYEKFSGLSRIGGKDRQGMLISPSDGDVINPHPMYPPPMAVGEGFG